MQKLLRNLKPYKASGPDDVSPRFLKEIIDHPSWPLYSRDHWYKTGYLMNGKNDEWKEATVSPIFKKDKSKPVNYRPVSLMPICSKVLEHIIHSHLMNFFEKNQILCDQQHGFRKQRSCESQLLLRVQDLASGLDNNQQIDAILLGFSKAFDKVPHRRLLAKLEFYGVRGKMLQWICSSCTTTELFKLLTSCLTAVKNHLI